MKETTTGMMKVVDVDQIVLTTMAILGSINHSSIPGTGCSV